MPRDRSHAHVELGQQLYAVLEQCRKPEILWAELATGHHDWLGVRRNGEYVLGRPRLSNVVPEDPGLPPDDATAPHRTESLGPLQRVPRWESHVTPEEAGAAFRRLAEVRPRHPPADLGCVAGPPGAARPSDRGTVRRPAAAPPLV